MSSGTVMPVLHDRRMSYVTTHRLSDQLNELEASVRTVLQTIGHQSTHSIDIERVFNPDVVGSAPSPNAVAIRLLDGTAHPDLVLYPIHPESQSEISVGVQGLNRHLDEFGNTEREPCIHKIEPVALFHSRFRPLPASWPDELYRATHRINVQLTASPDDEDIAAILTTLDSLQDKSYPLLKPENSQVFLTYFDTAISDAAKRACAAMNLNSEWQAHTIKIDRVSDYHALLGNTTVAIQAIEALCADALLAGIPCIAWKPEASGKLLHSLADIQFTNTPLHDQTRIKYISELQLVLQHCLLAIESDDTSNEFRSRNTTDTRAFETILSPGIDAIQQPELATRLSHSLNRGQRKYNKFRESPGRFVNDSQSPLLRPFKNKRSSS